MTLDVLWQGFYDFVTLISLALTLPALVASFVTVWKWKEEHAAYCEAENPSKSQTINAGIFRGFLGSFVDNLWWGFAWTFDYLGMDAPRNVFFTYGVFSNVFFRQIATTWAGSMHIRAEIMSRPTDYERKKGYRDAVRLIAITALASALYVWALLYLK